MYSAGKPIVFQGYANDYDRKIVGIQFSLDQGETWTTYRTEHAEAGRLVEWRFEYTPESSGEYRMKVRSINDVGQVSPQAATMSFCVT